jgi:sulfate transport system permease protein
MGRVTTGKVFIWRRRTAIPGFGITFGVTFTLLCLVVLIPLAAIIVRGASLSPQAFVHAAFSERALASYRLSVGAAAVGALVNGVFGLATAWALVRYSFPGKALLNALVDLPFALPTAVAGVSLAVLYGPQGWLGAPLQRLGLPVANTPAGVAVALTFIGLPFVVRTVEPVLRDLALELEEAAATLGASRVQTLVKVIAPALAPAWLTGFALAFARGLGEYGSVIFIAGNMPYRSEIAPLLITIELEQFDYASASAIALVMLAISFIMLAVVNTGQGWMRRSAQG